MTSRSDFSNDLYANIVDSVGDGVIAIDATGDVTLMNPAAEELTGVSRKTAQGNPFARTFRGEEILIDMVTKTATTGMALSDHENVALKRPAHPVPVSVTTTPLLAANGEQMGVILVLRDLTNIRELEDAVRHADRLSSLGTLAAGLAHEIKNPLGGIKGAAQLMEQEIPADSELRDYTRVMLKEAQRVNRIVDELLDLASPRKLQQVPTNIHQILGDIILLQKRSSSGKNILFQKNFDPSIPPILADEGLLTQLFLNLIKNAVEAVGENGAVKVTSRIVSEYSMTQKGERRSRMVAVEVNDNGTGISKEQQEQLFTPFFTTKNKGTGLGLAICHKIVAEHRGMIKVESEPGKGTTFSVMLPLIQ
jgi:two-component system nitrogen regulation sensor histidine kinase GlnL